MGNNEFAINNHFDTDMLNMDPLASTERTRTPGGRGAQKLAKFCGRLLWPLSYFL